MRGKFAIDFERQRLEPGEDRIPDAELNASMFGSIELLKRQKSPMASRCLDNRPKAVRDGVFTACVSKSTVSLEYGTWEHFLDCDPIGLCSEGCRMSIMRRPKGTPEVRQEVGGDHDLVSPKGGAFA
jgi:hypothetical protein